MDFSLSACHVLNLTVRARARAQSNRRKPLLHDDALVNPLELQKKNQSCQQSHSINKDDMQIYWWQQHFKQYLHNRWHIKAFFFFFKQSQLKDECTETNGNTLLFFTEGIRPAAILYTTPWDAYLNDFFSLKIIFRGEKKTKTTADVITFPDVGSCAKSAPSTEGAPPHSAPRQAGSKPWPMSRAGGSTHCGPYRSNTGSDFYDTSMHALSVKYRTTQAHVHKTIYKVNHLVKFTWKHLNVLSWRCPTRKQGNPHPLKLKSSLLKYFCAEKGLPAPNQALKLSTQQACPLNQSLY